MGRNGRVFKVPGPTLDQLNQNLQGRILVLAGEQPGLRTTTRGRPVVSLWALLGITMKTVTSQQPGWWSFPLLVG